MMKERTDEDIYTYYKQALDLIPLNHPHYQEIKTLLVSQVNDELHDHASSNRITN